jgi:signal transduction histidine kinase
VRRQVPGLAPYGRTAYGFAAPAVFTGSPAARVLLTVVGFAVLTLVVGVLATETRWELLTAGILGLLAYNIGYPVLSRSRATPRGGVAAQIVHRPDALAARRGMARRRTRERQLELARRECMANVSHELRAPLTVLAGYLETVREIDLDPEVSRDYLDRMDAQCRRMQRIIEDQLRLATPDAPEPSRGERVGIAGVLACIRGDAEALSAGRHRIALDADGDYDLLGAESELTSALGNLVANAVRYTPPGGRVRLVWRATAAGAEFAVEDTGIGIEKAHIPRLTERYYRVESDPSRRGGGTGIGLALVKRILERHEATLEIESEPGKGSRFTARFPAHRVIIAATTPAGRPRRRTRKKAAIPLRNAAELEAAATLQ